MTNPIAIAPKPASLPGIQTGKLKADGGPTRDFAGLIDVGNGPGGNARRAPASPPQSAAQGDAVPGPDSTALGDRLSALLEELAALSKKLDENGSLDDSDIEHLDALLAGLQSVLEQAPVLADGSLDLTRLAEHAAQLGMTPGASPADSIARFEALADLSTTIADGLRGTRPERAARLTGLAHALDVQSAALETALAEQQAIAANATRQAETQTRLNPAAAIADAQSASQADLPGTGPEHAKPASVDPAAAGERSLVKAGSAAGPDTQTSGNTSGGSGGNGASGGNAAASTAPAAPELEAPDGLVLPAGQSQTQPLGAANAAARPEAAFYQRPDTHVNVPFIAAEIARHVQNGISRFEIRMNPPELGRIDVRMEMDTSGAVVARLAVERSETLDLLQRDQRALMRALADAGLDAGKTDLQFSLSQEGQKGFSGEDRPGWRTSVVANSGIEPSITATNADSNPYMRGYARLDAVNLWV